MRRIHLTQGKYALVDDSDYDYLNQWKWQYKPPIKEKYCGYATRRIRKPKTRQTLKTVYMHTQIMGYVENDHIDHRDGDGLNNQRNNLRRATHSMNAANKQIREDNTSGYKGVSWKNNRAGTKNWGASIGVKGKRLYLGLFYTAHDAAMAYNKAAIKYHGEFAKLNPL